MESGGQGGGLSVPLNFARQQEDEESIGWVREVICNTGGFVDAAVIVGRETPIIFSAVLTIHCRVMQLDTVQFPYYMVTQLVRILSIVSL